MNEVKSGLFLAVLILTCVYASPAQVSIRTSILEEVNKARQAGCKCGENYMPPVPPLVWDERLEKAASRHANDMYHHHQFNHTGSDGSSLEERISKTGYKWELIGENIATGYTNSTDVVTGWKGSPGHCKTMMNAGFQEMGAARKGSYWVMDLGSRN